MDRGCGEAVGCGASVVFVLGWKVGVGKGCVGGGGWELGRMGIWEGEQFSRERGMSSLCMGFVRRGVCVR